MRNTIVLLIFTLFLFVACKPKGVTYSIKGTVFDASFNQSFADGKVQLFEKSVTGFAYKEVATVYTTSEGEFKITFPRNRVLDYKIVITKDDYFQGEFIILPNELIPNDDYQQTFSMYAHAWVKIHLQNVDEVNSYDDLIYKKLTGKEDCVACCPNGETQHFYGANDTTFYCMAEGGKPFSYYYELSNTAFMGNEQVIAVPLDTVTLETLY